MKSINPKICLIAIIAVSAITLGLKNYYNKEKYNKVLAAFNHKDYEALNKFIHPSFGIFIAGYDGVYPECAVVKSIDKDSVQFAFRDSVFTNLEFKTIEYLGNGKFKKDGAFLVGFSTPYIDELNSPHSPLNDNLLEQARKLESITKFRVDAVSKDRRKVCSFYFGVDNNTLYLCAISCVPVADATLINTEAKGIKFDNETDVTAYLKGKRFCDVSGVNYVDFTTNTMIDWHGSDIEYFDKIKIGDIEFHHDGDVKQREIIFNDKYDQEVDKLLLTSNGELIRLGSGVNPQINYSICKTTVKASNNELNEIPALDSIIRNRTKALYFQRLIKENGNQDYSILQDTSEKKVVITNRKTGEIYTYSDYFNDIEAYTFYSTQSIPAIKTYFHKKGATVDEFGVRLNTGGSSTCILLSLSQDGSRTKVSASWECD